MFGVADETTAIKTLHDALDARTSFFDSSPYTVAAWPSGLGIALKGKRDDVIVGTKAGRYRFEEFDFSPGGFAMAYTTAWSCCRGTTSTSCSCTTSNSSSSTAFRRRVREAAAARTEGERAGQRCPGRARPTVPP
jgi:hypothetical protein